MLMHFAACNAGLYIFHNPIGVFISTGNYLKVAAHYGVRPTFAALAFLSWAAGPGRLTPTADCLSMLGQELRPLKRAESSLLPEVLSYTLLVLGWVKHCPLAMLRRGLPVSQRWTRHTSCNAPTNQFWAGPLHWHLNTLQPSAIDGSRLHSS